MPYPQEQTDSTEERVDRLAQSIERLRIGYEQYFLGRERIPPTRLRDEVERMMLRMVNLTVQNTSLKFQIQTLKAKLNTYRRLWDRTLLEMEEGRSNRDRFRLRLYKEKMKSGTESTASKKDKAQPTVKTKRNEGVETLLDQYKTAREKCKESTKGISYDNFAKTLASQTNSLKKKYNCKTVRFKVVVENGKTKLKATPIS